MEPQRSGKEPHPLLVLGGYGLVVLAVFGLASVGSAAAVVGIGVLLAGVIAALVWWSGMPLPQPSRPSPVPSSIEAVDDESAAATDGVVAACGAEP